MEFYFTTVLTFVCARQSVSILVFSLHFFSKSESLWTTFRISLSSAVHISSLYWIMNSVRSSLSFNSSTCSVSSRTLSDSCYLCSARICCEIRYPAWALSRSEINFCICSYYSSIKSCFSEDTSICLVIRSVCFKSSIWECSCLFSVRKYSIFWIYLSRRKLLLWWGYAVK